MTPTPPVLTPTPGGGISADPDVTTQLALNDHLFLIQWAKYQAIMDYLNKVKGWKENSQQRVALGLPLDQAPTPPPGYDPTPEPVEPPPAPPSYVPVIQVRSQFGQYPAPGDNNAPGTIINNPYGPGKLRKVVSVTPFGSAHWWEDVK